MEYLGHLDRNDPLYGYLSCEIQPQLRPWGNCDYRVFRFGASNDVYLYEEKHTDCRVIGKFFFNSRQRDRAAAARRLDREFNNLVYMRQQGFDRSPHYIARPLGRNGALNELLVEECCYGELFSSVIRRSIFSGDQGLLFDKLTSLAWFLCRFHNRTALSCGVDFNAVCSYEDGLIDTLCRQGLIDWNSGQELYALRDHWRSEGFMWEDCQVAVHGDATPENFLFGDGRNVVTFDLERLRRSDRVYDVGRVAGELAHFFMGWGGDRGKAEPFIGHFLWEYACHFPDRDAAFRSISRRLPFYMGINLLRIARNNWLNWEYRRRLVHAAKQCLQGVRR